MAIIPADGKVCSPIDGEVVTMIDTNHAIGLETKGVEILIHIGMDTVKLEGKHFKSNIKEGYKIKYGKNCINGRYTVWTYNRDVCLRKKKEEVDGIFWNRTV